MLIPHQTKRTVALCLVAAWASLYGIHVADTLEDAREGPEPIDVQVAQALATPAEQPLYLSEAQLGTSTSPSWGVVSPLRVPDVHVWLAVSPTPSLSMTGGPPPRAKPPLFQLFSVYRL